MISSSNKSNILKIDNPSSVMGFVSRFDNYINIGAGQDKSNFVIEIFGNNNYIEIASGHMARGLKIVVGGRNFPAKSTKLLIGRWFSVEPNTNFYLSNSGSSLSFGDSCMLSNNITVRCGEMPHLIFDISGGDYLDKNKSVVFGKHVSIHRS